MQRMVTSSLGGRDGEMLPMRLRHSKADLPGGCGSVGAHSFWIREKTAIDRNSADFRAFVNQRSLKRSEAPALHHCPSVGASDLKRPRIRVKLPCFQPHEGWRAGGINRSSCRLNLMMSSRSK